MARLAGPLSRITAIAVCPAPEATAKMVSASMPPYVTPTPQERNAMAARGYWQAFQLVERSIGKVLKGESPGVVAEQDQVEIVVVIVIHPDGALEAPLREIRRVRGEAAFGIVIEERAGLGENAKVHEPIVVEVARGDGDHAGQLFEAALGEAGLVLSGSHGGESFAVQSVGRAAGDERQDDNGKCACCVA